MRGIVIFILWGVWYNVSHMSDYDEINLIKIEASDEFWAIMDELDMMHGVSANIMCGQEGSFGTSAFQVYLDPEEMRLVDESVEMDMMTEDQKIEAMYAGDGPRSGLGGECDLGSLMIQNNVSNARAVDTGGDNGYNPGF